MFRNIARFYQKREHKGQAVVEFSILIVPAFLILLFCLLDLGRYLYCLSTVDQVSSYYAKQININPQIIYDSTLQHQTELTAKQNYPGANYGSMSITIIPQTPQTVQYKHRWIDTNNYNVFIEKDFDINKTDCSVTVKMKTKWLTPLGGIFGVGVNKDKTNTDNTFSISSTKYITTNELN